MTAVLLPEGKQQFFTTPGVPAVGYKLMTWAAGTSTPQATWADAGKIAANANPIILDARGEAVIFWDGAYKIQLQDPAGAPVWPPVDNVQSSPTPSTSLIPSVDNSLTLGSPTFSWANIYLGPNHAPAFDTVSGNIGYIARTAAELAATVTPTFYFYPPGDARRYGALLNGTADDTAAINNACLVGSGGATAGGIAYVAPGTPKITAPITMNISGITLQGAGENATNLILSSTTQNGVVIGNGSNNPNNCWVRNLTISPSGTQSAGAAVLIQNAHRCGIDRVVFGNNLFWAVDFEGGASQFEYFLSNFEINSCVYGVVMGNNGSLLQNVWIDRGEISSASLNGMIFVTCSGAYVSKVDTILCGNGVGTFPATGKNVDALFFDTVLCDTTTGNGWNFITNGGTVSEVMLTACWASSCGTALGATTTQNGIYISAGSGGINGVTINGAVISNCKGAGILNANALNVAILNSQIFDNSAVGSAVRSGIEIGAGVSSFQICNNVIGAGGFFGGVNLQAYGIDIAVGASSNYNIQGNNLGGNVSGPMRNGTTAFSQLTKVSGNVGYSNAARGAGAILSGNSSAVVTHGLNVTPAQADIIMTPTTQLSTVGAIQLWVSTTTATTFTINSNAAVSANAFFAWDIRTAGAQF